MMLFRLVGILVIVILGSIAAEDLFKLLTSILPLLIILAIVCGLGWSWRRHRRR